MKLKYQLIFRPLCMLSLVLIVGYSFLIAVVLIPNHYFNLKEELFNLYIPMALPWVPLYFLMLPRFNLLQPRNAKANLNFPLALFSWMVMFIATALAINYLQKATGKMEHLQSISEFEKKGSPQYCTLQNAFIWKKKIGHSNRIEISNKGGTLNYYTYITLPIFEKIEDTIKEDCSYWLVVEYHQSTSNRASQEIKAKALISFHEYIMRGLLATNFNQFEYLESLGNNELRKQSDNAIRQSILVRYKDPLFFKASKEPFDKRFGNIVPGFFVTLIIGGLLIWTIIYFNKLRSDDPDVLNSLQMEWDPINIETIKPREGFYSTPILVLLNVVVFLIMVFSGEGFISFHVSFLLRWGANHKLEVINGEWCRLLTNIFLHAGIMHLLFNMFALLYIGSLLEPLLGRTKFWFYYILTGIVASICSISIHAQAISVGASGAIFGMYGIFLAFLFNGMFPKAINKVFLINTLLFVGINLIMGMSGNVDNAAHIGGLLTGLLIGLIVAPGIQINNPKKE